MKTHPEFEWIDIRKALRSFKRNAALSTFFIAWTASYLGLEIEHHEWVNLGLSVAVVLLWGFISYSYQRRAYLRGITDGSYDMAKSIVMDLKKKKANAAADGPSKAPQAAAQKKPKKINVTGE